MQTTAESIVCIVRVCYDTLEDKHYFMALASQKAVINRYLMPQFLSSRQRQRPECLFSFCWAAANKNTEKNFKGVSQVTQFCF